MRILVALFVALTGCTIYTGDDAPVDPPEAPDAGCALVFDPPPPRLLLDPTTATCVPVRSGGSCDLCGVCTPAPPAPAWAPCDGPCTGLDEATCAAQDGCHIARGTDFLGCNNIFEPVEPLACQGLDAYACASQPGCISIHDDTTRAFVTCIAEAPRCADADEPSCIANASCEPLYRGVDCTCTGDTCTCASQEFLDCRDAP